MTILRDFTFQLALRSNERYILLNFFSACDVICAQTPVFITNLKNLIVQGPRYLVLKDRLCYFSKVDLGV